MRRILYIIFVIMVLITALCACSPAQTQYSVEKNGVTYEVNKDNKTIFDGTNVFKYEFEGNESDYRVDITYPDGSTYWWAMKGYGGSGGWSDDYDPKKYADGDVLTNVILEDVPKAPKNSGGNLVAIILLIAVGIFNIAAPQSGWYMQYGWRYKDAEPSDLAIGVNRFGGIVAIIIAIILIFA